MKQKWKILLLVLVSAAVLSSAVGALAEAGYTLDWWTVDGGGGANSTGGPYALAGSIGQPDAGEASGGGYTLAGGFWGGAGTGELSYESYLPLVIR
jgi:hypothetical protein